jgi:hypothetical protein
MGIISMENCPKCGCKVKNYTGGNYCSCCDTHYDVYGFEKKNECVLQPPVLFYKE